MKKKTPFISKLYVALIFVFLYAPILVMMLFSLNSTSSTYIFSGFSTHWYNEMFKDTVAVQALKNTVLLAVCTALVSTVLGVLAAVGLFNSKSKLYKSAMMTTTEATPIMIPTMVKKDRNLWLIIELIANFQFCIRSPFPACYLRRSLHHE